jgi:prevent-host-death family protein
MRIAPLADVKARLSAYVDECVADGPIVITRNGKAVAILLGPERRRRSGTNPARTFSPFSSNAQPFQAEHQGTRGPIREGFLESRAKTSARTKGGGGGRPRRRALRKTKTTQAADQRTPWPQFPRRDIHRDPHRPEGTVCATDAYRPKDASRSEREHSASRSRDLPSPSIAR